jgi:hypothetical protein
LLAAGRRAPGLVAEEDTMTVDPIQDLAQFEPDPDGDGSALGAEPGVDAVVEPIDDPQWITWPDAADESMWAADELTQIGAGWGF